MKNCLVTKLKASVNKDLPIAKSIRLYVSSIDNPTVTTQQLNLTTKNGNIELYSNSVGCYKTGFSGEIESYPIVASGIQKCVENKDGMIVLKDKYNLLQFTIPKAVSVDIRDLSAITGLSFIELRGNKQEIKSLELFKEILLNNKDTLKSFAVSNRYGEIPNGVLTKEESLQFSKLSILTGSSQFIYGKEVNFSWLPTSITNCSMEIPGKLSDLAPLTELEDIVLINPNITGDVMDFITPWISAGRTSGSIYARYIMRNKYVLTYNGTLLSEAFPDVQNIVSSKLSWTSNGTVTITNS